MPAAPGGPRLLLRRLREAMAEPVSPQARLDRIVVLIAANVIAEVCSVYVLRDDNTLELFATEGHRLPDRRAVPQGPVLVGQEHGDAVGPGARGAARALEQDQRKQPGGTGVLGAQAAQRAQAGQRRRAGQNASSTEGRGPASRTTSAEETTSGLPSMTCSML